MEALRDVALIVGGYLMGSIPMGVLIARLTGGRDPRTVGSGRTGGTNAFRAMGPARGVATGLLDIVKGALPVAMARVVGAPDVVQALVGVAAVLGASRSLFLRFQGGRGVATGIGALLVLQPLVLLLCAPIFFGVILLSRYVSLGSLLASAAAAVLLALLVGIGFSHPATLLYGVAATLLIWLAHADNIDRLVHGRERKFSFAEREAS
jgi:glycerol-3-phosphate acyltransferase PlsY